MPNDIIQPSFAGGEISPSLRARVDLQRYGISVKTLKNFIVHSQGGASTRPGTEYIATVKNSSKKVRLIPFEFSDEQSYVLEFGDLYIRFYMDGGQVLNAGVPYEIVSPYGENDIEELKFVQSADVLYIVHPDYPPQELARLSHTNWTITEYDMKTAPLLKENDTDTTITITGSVQRTGPASDIAKGGWGSSTGTNLWSLVDEATPSDTDYITSPSSLGVAELKFSSVVTPRTRKGHLLRYRVACADGNYRGYTIAVYCGSTEIYTANDGVWPNQPFVTKILYIPEYYAKKITDYTDLRVKITGYYTNVKISWIEFQCPVAVSGGVNVERLDDDLFKGSSVTVTASSNLFQQGHVGSVWGVRHTTNSQSNMAIVALYDAGLQTSPFPAYKNYNITFYLLDTIDEKEFVFEQSTDEGASWITFKRRQPSANTGQEIYTGSVDDFSWIRFRRPEATAGAETCKFVIDYTGQEQFCYFKITEYTSATSVKAELLTNFNRNGAAFTSWSEAAWSDVRGWPSCAVFYQDRLCFGSTSNSPQNIWASKTSEYDDHGVSFPLEDTDAININLASRKINKIRNMVDLDQILVLTNDSEWLVGAGGDNGVFTPSTVKSSRQGNRGSHTVDPVVIGNRIIYIQSMGSIVRDLGYDLNSNGFNGDELSIFASHLFSGYTIDEMAYQQNPSSIVWMIRSDGKLIGLTYLKEHQVLAWHHHETAGTFESVCSIPGDGYDEVWFVVKRGSNRFIERMAKFSYSDTASDYFQVDCGATYSGSPATTISGLTWLTGSSVSILADGVVKPSQTVTAGAITLTSPASKVIIGLPFTPELEPLKPEIQTNGGTMQSKKMAISNVVLRVINSRGGTIGIDSNNLDAMDYREIDQIIADNKLYSGDITVPISGGYNNGGSFIIKQTDPLPITILALIPDVNVGG